MCRWSMADVVSHATITVKFSDKEWRLVLRALGYLAGIGAVRASPEDKRAAVELNTTLLANRKQNLLDQLKATEGAYKKSIEEVDPVDFGGNTV